MGISKFQHYHQETREMEAEPTTQEAPWEPWVGECDSRWFKDAYYSATLTWFFVLLLKSLASGMMQKCTLKQF